MFKTRYFMLLAVLLVVPAIACGGDKDDNDTEPMGSSRETPVATRTAGSTPAAGGAGANELAGAVRGFTSVKSFRATIVMETPGQPRQEGIIESQLPDRFHFRLGSIEMISIGADSYIKVGNTWTRSPGGGFGNIFDISDIAETVQLYTNDASIVKGGTETVAGKRCQLYTYSASGTTSELCVADDKPLRIVSDIGGAKSTIVFTDFDNVEVKAPI